MSSRIKAALERIIRFGSRMKNRSPSSRTDATLAEQNNGAGDCQYSSPKQIQVEPCRAQQCKPEPPVHNPRAEACYRTIGKCGQTNEDRSGSSSGRGCTMTRA